MITIEDVTEQVARIEALAKAGRDGQATQAEASLYTDVLSDRDTGLPYEDVSAVVRPGPDPDLDRFAQAAQADLEGAYRETFGTAQPAPVESMSLAQERVHGWAQQLRDLAGSPHGAEDLESIAVDMRRWIDATRPEDHVSPASALAAADEQARESERLRVALQTAQGEASHLRAQVAELLPYASAGADALDSWEPYGDAAGAERAVLQEGATAMIARIRAGEFGTLASGVSVVGDPTGRPGGSLADLDNP